MLLRKIKNISVFAEIFDNLHNLGSVNFNAGAWYALAGEMVLFSLDEDYFAINRSMNSEVAAHESARAGKLSSAGLANENFASLHLLTTETLDAKSLAGIVV